MGYARFSPCSVLLPAKSKKLKFRTKMRGKFNSEEVDYKWLMEISLA